jgi:hypothetical protein
MNPTASKNNKHRQMTLTPPSQPGGSPFFELTSMHDKPFISIAILKEQSDPI